jgi:hypothetical protein
MPMLMLMPPKKNPDAVKYEDLPNEVGTECCSATWWLWLMQCHVTNIPMLQGQCSV